jgi:penicillin-binding protein 2
LKNKFLSLVENQISFSKQNYQNFIKSFDSPFNSPKNLKEVFVMFFRLKMLSAKSVFAVILTFCFAFVSFGVNGQTKKTTAKSNSKTQTSGKTASKKADEKTKSKKVDDKKSAKKSDKRSDRKSDKNTASAKDQAKDKAKTNGKDNKNKKPTKAELAKQAEKKREEAEREAAARRAEEARRQAALAEKRRREQAAREARARQLAFERGLKTETQENIANDNTEGEDLEVRRAAIDALGNHAGTVVVMEPQTGKVLSIVNQEWGIRRGFKPCSTIKLVTGVAGVNEQVIEPTGNIRNRSFRLDLDDALAHSNNSYFQVVGKNIGNERMISYARALGLGEKTGINAENETAGKLPYGNNNARIYSHGDDFEVTPLQLGVMVSALSNGGKIVVPQIPRTKVEKTNFRGFMRREIDIPSENLQRVLPGMIGAVNYGTAKRASDYSLNIAGKTGSCIGQGSWLGLFASVAPVVNPRLAIVVITRGSGERGKYASGIAGQIYKSLAHRFNDGRDFTAKVPLELKPQQKTNAQTSAQLDNDEGEDSEEGDTLKPAPKPTVTPKKSTEKNNKNVFEPIIITKKSDSKKSNSTFDPTVIVVGKEKTRPRVVQSKP